MTTKIADKLPREDWAFEELQQEAEELRTRLNRFRTSLGRFFINKQELIDLMLVAAVAQVSRQEHFLAVVCRAM